MIDSLTLIDHYCLKKGFYFDIKGALNPNFIKLTKEKNFGSRNVLVAFPNLLWNGC